MKSQKKNRILVNKLVAKKIFEEFWKRFIKKRNLEREKFLKDFFQKFYGKEKMWKDYQKIFEEMKKHFELKNP